jgi:hypothetical protein
VVNETEINPPTQVQNNGSNRTSNVIIGIILIILFVIVGCLAYQNNQLQQKVIILEQDIATIRSPAQENQTEQTDPSDISDKINLGKDTYKIISSDNQGFNKFVSTEANFSFEYPEDLLVSDYTSDAEHMGRQIFICEVDIIPRSDVHYQKCTSGMMIWYDGDGWGGGCSEEYHNSIIYDNESHSYCNYDDRFAQLYLNLNTGREHKFLIEGQYSEIFTPEVASKIIQSIVIE